MTSQRRPTDDLQPGEMDGEVTKISLIKKYKVWYVNTSGKDASCLVSAKDVFEARTEAILQAHDVSYVVRASEIN
jgi:hypothetical protein